MNPQQIQLQMDHEVQKELEQPFPIEYIPENFWMYAKKALRNQTIPSLRMNFQTYEKIIQWINDEKDSISFYEISFLINCIVSTTPKQFEELENEYLEIQRQTNDLLIKWNDIVTPIKTRIIRKFEAQARIAMPGINGSKFHK